MRNLVLSGRKRIHHGALKGLRDIKTCYDDLEDKTYICGQDMHASTAFFSLTRDFELEQLFFVSQVEITRVVSMDVVSSMEGERMVLVTQDAHILTSPLASTELSFDAVGRMGSGCVLAAAWNPDRTLLAIVESGNALSLLSSTFDPIREGKVIMEDEGRSGELVSVGWGKKETQFHGAAGKQAALKRDTFDESLLPTDDGRVAIVWHPDGPFFACSVVFEGSTGLTRKIYVYEQTGTCYSISEPLTGLEGSALAWKPNGELIAAVQRLEGKRRIIFFERNGLRHGEFCIDDIPVRSLEWNADASILAVHYHAHPDMLSHGKVQLWTMGNYHYYLKQEFLDHTEWTHFHHDDPRIMHAKQNRDIFAYHMDWSIDSHGSTVCVIDGKRVLITPFHMANIPPPLSVGEVSFAGPVNQVSIFNHGNRCKLAVVLSDGSVVVKSIVITLDEVQTLEEERYEGSYLQVVCLVDVCHALRTSPGSDGQGSAVVKLGEGTPTLKPATSIRRSFDGQLLTVDADGSVNGVFFLSEACPWFDVKDNHLLALTPAGRLLIDDTPLITNCTSCILTDDFLVLTTSDHWLRFFPFATLDSWQSLPAPSDTGLDPELDRRIERGARLVTVIPSTAMLVLQMPRGNLETIHPRAMVLSSVRHHLDQLDYLEAYLLCRRHRVDLNVLVDHKPAIFLSTIDKFVDAVGGRNPEYLNLFLTTLNDQDVTLTKFRGSNNKTSESLKDKCRVVSERVRNACSSDPSRFFDVITTSLVIQKRYEEALTCILELCSSHPNQVEKSLKHLLFLVDAEQMYRVALGMYNLPLALSIARRSQMDPKEFNDFLEGLNALPEARRRFRIDDHLKRYKLAVAALHGECKHAGDYEEFMQYVRQHSAFKDASEVVEFGSPLYCSIMHEYAELLVKNGDLRSAFGALRLASANDRILSLALQHPVYWREAICIAPEQANALCGALIHSKHYLDAYQVARSHLHDQARSLSIAIEGSMWEEVRMLPGDITPSIQLAYERYCSDLSSTLQALQEKGDRLMSAQSILCHRLTVELVHPEASSHDTPDNMSEMSFATTTTARTKLTGMSGLTRLSTKSKRKAERQRLRDKPGSKHEREYLHHVISESLQHIQSASHEIAALIRLLVDRHCIKEAKALQSQMRAIEAWITAFVPEFNSKEVSNGKSIDVTHPIVAAYIADVRLCLQLDAPTLAPYALAFLE